MPQHNNLKWTNPDEIKQPDASQTIWQKATERLLNHEQIPQQDKANMHTVIDMARFIRANMKPIAYIVDVLSQDPQKARRYFPDDHDYHNRVLRDHRGVSFHVGNYESGSAFQTTLNQRLDDFEQALDTLLNDEQSHNLLHRLAFQFQDDNLSCFEQRLSNAWEWLANYKAQIETTPTQPTESATDTELSSNIRHASPQPKQFQHFHQQAAYIKPDPDNGLIHWYFAQSWQGNSQAQAFQQWCQNEQNLPIYSSSDQQNSLGVDTYDIVSLAQSTNEELCRRHGYIQLHHLIIINQLLNDQQWQQAWDCCYQHYHHIQLSELANLVALHENNMKQAAKQAIIRKNNFSHNTLVALLKLDGVRKQTSFLQKQFTFGSWYTMAHHLMREYFSRGIKDLARQLCEAPNDLTTPIIYSMGMKTIDAWTPMHQIMCDENSRNIQPIINLFNQNGENQKEFIKIMGIQTNSNWTPMHRMMDYGNDAFLHIDKKTLKAIGAWTPMHLMMYCQMTIIVYDYQLSEEIHAMIHQVLTIFNQDVIGRKQLLKIMGMKNDINWTPMHLMMRYQSSDVVKKFLAIVNQDTESPKQLINIMGIKDKRNFTPMHYMMKNQSSDVTQQFLAIVNQDTESPKQIINIMGMKDKGNSTPIHLMMSCQSSDAVQQALAIFNQDFVGLKQLSKIMGIKNDNNWTPMHQLMEIQSSNVVLQLLKLFNHNDKNQKQLINSMGIKDDNHLTPMHSMMSYQSSDVVKKFLAIVNQDTESRKQLINIMSIKDKDDFTPMHRMMFYQSSDVVQQALSILNQDTTKLFELINIKNEYSWTPMHYMMRNQSSDAVQKALIILDQDIAKLFKLININHHYCGTPLHLMMRYQSNDAVQKALIILDQDIAKLIKLMNINDRYCGTPLHLLMRYQSSNVVQLFAEILNRNSLANEEFIHLFKIENNAGNTALHLAAHYQTTQGMAAFFACLNTTIDLSNFIIEEATQRQLARQLIEPTLWQRYGIKVNVKQLSDQLLNYTYFCQEVQDAYLAGIPVAETLVEQLKNNTAVEAPMFQQAVASNRSGDNHQATSSYYSSAMIYLPTVAELNTVSQLYEHLGTVLNYFNVQARRTLYEHAHPDLRPALEDIWRKRGFLPSSDAIQKPQQALTNSEQQALEQFHQGQALVKIIKPDNFQDFLQQLKNPQYRPKHLRTRHSYPQYKYVHLEDRIVHFDPDHKNRIKQNYCYTKKTAMTLISQQLNTPVFGLHDPHRELVGLQFDSQQAQYKAYLQEDHGTVDHGWYSGNYDGAQKYSSNIYFKNFTDFNSFWQQVQKNGSRLVNETLAKVNLAGLQSVVIARDTNNARQFARKRSQQLSQAAQKPIPIVFYDCMRQQISPYTTLQQQADEQQLSEQQQANEQSTSPQA